METVLAPGRSGHNAPEHLRIAANAKSIQRLSAAKGGEQNRNAKAPEVERLHREGHSLNSICKILKIGARMVRTILDGSDAKRVEL